MSEKTPSLHANENFSDGEGLSKNDLLEARIEQLVHAGVPARYFYPEMVTAIERGIENPFDIKSPQYETYEAIQKLFEELSKESANEDAIRFIVDQIKKNSPHGTDTSVT